MDIFYLYLISVQHQLYWSLGIRSDNTDIIKKQNNTLVPH